MELIPSPLFYMGNKLKLLPQLKPLFPENIKTFYDLFGGSGVVSLNVEAKKTKYNELNPNIYEMLKLFKDYEYQEIINHINKRVEEFNLPKINYSGNNKQQLLERKKKYNKNYLDFRKFYNKSKKNYLDLYTLTFFSYSNLIRFNSKSEFNMPIGKQCYLKEHDQQISYACYRFKTLNIELRNEEAINFIKNNFDDFDTNDFIYLDPPYLNTLAIYNEKRAFGGWNIDNDYELFEWLEKLNDKGVKWGLSNVFQNKEYKNEHLINWCEKNKWNINHLQREYACLGKGGSNTDEVYICNYPTPKQMTLF